MTAPRLQPGYVVAGKYTIRAAVAYGGASATYAAQATPGKDLALKIYSPDLAARPDVLAALQQVTAVTNALPADVTGPILDSGFDPQTRAPYVVTDFVPLTTLAQAVAGGPMQPGDVVTVLRGISRAVDAAHAQRLAHAGLKPQNVFVGPGPQRQIRVLDFGVATARAAVPTSEGYALSAPWIAPEQLQPGAAGPAVDVFSAALVAFFAATARPFWLSCQGPTPDLARWHQEIAAPRASAASRAREIGAILPPTLDPVFARALSLNPAERFASVGELAEAFARATSAPQAAVSDLGSTLAVDMEAPFPKAPGPVAAGAPVMASAPYPQAAPLPPLQQQAMAADPVQLPQRSKKGLFILLALLGVGLVGGVVALVLVSRGPKSEGATASSASAAPSASTPVAAAPAPSESAPATSAAPPAPSASTPEPPPSAAGPEAAELTIVCTPECDSITIDDNALTDNLTDPVQLPAGAHTITATKASYVTQTKKVTLKPGQKLKATIALFKPGPAVAPTKHCGKFLERCP